MHVLHTEDCEAAKDQTSEFLLPKDTFAVVVDKTCHASHSKEDGADKENRSCTLRVILLHGASSQSKVAIIEQVVAFSVEVEDLFGLEAPRHRASTLFASRLTERSQ